MTTENLFDQIKADREAGTQGEWKSPCAFWNYGWDFSVETPTNGNSFISFGTEVAPLGVVAVDAAWGKDDKNEADARRIARVPQLEKIAAAADVAQTTFEEVRDGLNWIISEFRTGPDGEGQDWLDTLEACKEDCEAQIKAIQEATQ